MSEKPKIKRLKFLRKLRTIAFLNVFVGLIKKNLKLLLRSKSSALIVLLGPILIIGLVGAAFNTTSFYNINVGTYSGYYNDLTLSILDELEDKDFTVMKVNTKEECISKIKRAELHVCAIFPDDMKIGGEEGVVFHVDKTRMNIVWLIMDTLSSKISTKSSELSKELTNVLITTLEDTKSKIREKEGSLEGAISSNMKISNGLTGFSDNLSNINLEYSTNDLGIKNLKSRILSTLSGLGLEEGSFNDVFDELSKIENRSYAYSNKFNDARESVSKVKEGLSTLGSSVSESVYTMHQIASTLSSIMARINTIKHADAGTIVTPIKTSIEPVIAEKTHLNNMFPTLLVLIIMFIGLLLASTMVVREKTGASYFRNFITPTGDVMFILGDYFTNFFILALQMVAVFLVSLIFFKEALYSVLFNAGVVLVLIISVFVMLGMFIGQLFNSEETNTLGAISIGSIMLFFSSTILPLEALPASIRSIANFNPFVLGESMLKEVMLFNVDLLVLLEPLVTLIVYIAVLSVFVLIARKINKRFV